MTLSRIPSRMLRDAAADRDDAELLADFIVTLLDALDIPEVADAVRDALEYRPAPSPPVARPLSPSGRGARRR